MAGNRKAAEELLYKYLKKMEGGGTVNVEIYKKLFAAMSNAEFDAFVGQVERKEIYISMIVPNASKDVKLATERNIAVGEELGAKFHQRIVMTDALTGEEILTPKEYLIVHLPVRRQNQHLIKKRSIPDSKKVIDTLSGQVTADSKGSAISLPELLALEGRGVEDSVLEMIKVRGGDAEALKAMEQAIREQGAFRLGPIEELGTKPTSTESLRALLLSLHLDTTLGK